MRTLSEAEKHWPRLDEFRSLTDLKTSVSSHNEPQITAALRSVCWKIFLLFQTLDRSTWSSKLADSRSTYDALRLRYLRAIEHPDEFDTSVDPLSENEESPWVALRADESLRAEIFQDIERCMPDNVYFRQPATQNMMLDILFVWCKMHPDVGYRQGMHEILAPILWVMERDAVQLNAGEKRDTLLAEVMDSKFIEQDSFTLFWAVMENARSFYAPAESGSNSKDTPMLARSARIFERYLPKVDPGLSAHLVKLEIVPQIFLLRWIRLLFGREFPLDAVLAMWDSLFAFSPSLDLVDFIAIAMLLRIRWKLVAADTNEAFTLLLRYPEPDTPPHTFINDALYLRDHLTPEGGAEIISRHGAKPPPIIETPKEVKTPVLRSASPALSYMSSRTRHTMPSPRSFVAQQGGLEAMIQNAAKGVVERGSTWNVGKAIRDAVGEVKKNVEAYQAAAAYASPSGGSTPRSGGREFRKPTSRSTSSLAGTLAQADTAASSHIRKKLEAMETRNKELAKMLESAVAELWEYHRERSEGNRTEGQEKQEEEKGKDEMEKLSLAIAKVQFVQVYMEDSSIPLPPLDNGKEKEENHTEQSSSGSPVLDRTGIDAQKHEGVVPATGTSTPTPLPTPAMTISAPSPSPSPSPGPPPNSDSELKPQDETQSRPSPSSQLNNSNPRPNPGLHANGPISTSDLTPKPTLSPHPPLRPKALLSSPSFAWMLGTTDEEAEIEAPRSTFAKASEHSLLASDERRRLRAGKGFLFGEDEDVGVGVKEEKERGAGKKGRKKRGSVSVARREGVGENGEEEFEGIGLSEVGRGGGG
ncbi:RabGAP/TBC [Sporormia fimetaria CBS 119925]|uniref:RabGAP/TBC n=1 Tax=Sporormia fimetaria CBS 119925 TaxID=1340428 RepID=A0A6A6V301_9PLEO|nr:RabGAP/TBC [Sporormia fimetaria CBS 119925]